MRALLWVLLCTPLLVQAGPEINIGAMYEYMDGQKSTLLKRVRNMGDTTAFVKVSVVELVYAEDGSSREHERYFRVRFEPVLPDQGDGFGLSADESEDYRESFSAGVNVLAGYGAILFVRPLSPRYQTDIKQEPERFLVHNNGNATLILDHFNDCATGGKQCEVPSKYHVRPGTAREFKKQAGRAYRFELIEGDKTRKVEIAG
ncbi:molecular chaperone [Pseudomonas rubra]|uniref:Molecular chaperone n=1 Tax=Pseudomonas rubra TaxID=2942627 RepID=A0ABT5P294_9PSED|nr:molecular chaperone [Pseudomonas rubra]MDD1012403.1 molecular chaperone [Pseudomonas rubra]MDD1037250.1 molecular chaperone [Pseudomonas rubra]MDD1152967.1 molecular chaperone [Pseudomonas rubra]